MVLTREIKKSRRRKGKKAGGLSIIVLMFPTDIKELLETPQKERDILYLNSAFIPLGATAHEALASADEDFRSDKSFPKSFSRLSLDSVPHFFDRQVYSGFSSLSTGEAQRLALLFSLVAQPKVLILDETLSAIPQVERKELLNYLNEELKETTLIYVDHHNDIASSGFWTHIINMDACELKALTDSSTIQ